LQPERDVWCFQFLIASMVVHFHVVQGLWRYLDRDYDDEDVLPVTLRTPVTISMWNPAIQQHVTHQYPEGYWPEKRHVSAG